MGPTQDRDCRPVSFLFGKTITVVRSSPGGVDQYGDLVSGTTTSTAIAGCAVAPRYSSEPVERGRNGVIVGLSVYAPAGSDIRYTDAITIDSVSYRIDGEPASWSNPLTGSAPGVEVALVRSAG